MNIKSLKIKSSLNSNCLEKKISVADGLLEEVVSVMSFGPYGLYR